MSHRLRKLRIDRVDRVAAGANPHAEVVLFKSRAGEPPKTKEATVVADDKITDDERAKLDKGLAEKVLRMESDLSAAQETIKTLDGLSNDDIAALKGFEIAKATAEEEVLKGLSPEVRARIEKAESDAKAAADRLDAIEKAQKVEQIEKRLDGDDIPMAKALAPVIAQMDDANAKIVTQVLKATAARADVSNLYKELGQEAPPATPQEQASAAIAERLAKGESVVDAQKAVFAEHPEWYPTAKTVGA